MRVVRLGEGAPLGFVSTAVTIGNFDGVHRGHRALVERVVGRARATGGTAVVLSFDPHPARVLSPERAPAGLTTPEQKRELLAELGVDVSAELPFTAAVAAEPPEQFVSRVLAGELQARLVVVGETFRFGRRRAGDVDTLSRLGAAAGFGVEALAPVLEEGRAVSSSRVREALAQGDAAAASRLLGRTFFVDVRVVAGDGRGRTIGVPTANLETANEILPARGVYAARVRLPDGSWRGAVVNRGRRPTFGGETETVEAHLLDFDGHLYGAALRLAFAARLREERRFAGPEALVAQIREDVRQARALLSAPGGAGL
jgi:riboflavin kinase / FMN adenylyltransferase